MTDVNTNGEASLSQLPETAESADNIQCPRCRKNGYRRSAFCEIGSHWIHYGCDKLSESDIQRLTNDKGFIYNCKRCAASENTLRKHPVGTTSPREVIGPDTHKNGKQLPEASNKPVPNQQIVAGDIINQTSADVDSGVIMPDIQVKNKDCRTQAEAILDDENDATCAVCLGNIIETPNRCSKCLSMCHDSCLAATDADTDASICLTCHATEAQIKHGEEIQGAHINRDADTTLVPRQASSVSCSSGDKTQVKDGAEDGMTLKFQESSQCTMSMPRVRLQNAERGEQTVKQRGQRSEACMSQRHALVLATAPAEEYVTAIEQTRPWRMMILYYLPKSWDNQSSMVTQCHLPYLHSSIHLRLLLF